ncbi:ABC transporter ATP-binding protein [Actinomycetaceae bacterium TAE3-ERU4]|nr:ABC transporter ATP-binding protein [Actinomycetaceae bacterium TAE3-ERU4]
MTKNALSVTDLSVAYHDLVVLKGANLSVPEGEVIALLGPNGAGKSTLLKACMGLLPPLAGEVSFFGQPLNKVRKRVGYMPQAAEVDWDFPTTVLDTVIMGSYGKLGWLRRPGAEVKAAAMKALEKVGIPELASRQISQLSGGQKQRTFMARILTQDPDLFVMDEPFAGVDAASERAITSVLRELKEAGKTIIIVHHDLSTVKNFCSWVALLGGGKVMEAGPIEEVFRAETVAKAYGIDGSLFESEGKG